MNSPTAKTPKDDEVLQAAAAWALRNDRGLSAAEQDEFSTWLAASAYHRTAYAEARWGWEELDRLVGLQTSVHAIPDPDLLSPRHSAWAKAGAPPLRRRVLRFALPAAFAVAAAVVVGIFLTRPAAVPANDKIVGSAQTLALIEQRDLPDGSVIELNRGAVVTEHFTAGQRRVQLVRGEAHFRVAKDATRPFVVEAAGVAVRAVGTAFNVRLGAASVEVLVTEGKVRVDDAARGDSLLTATVPGETPVLSAGQKVIVETTPIALVAVAEVSSGEVEQLLAWKPVLLDFNSQPLGEVVVQFNRRNRTQLVIADEALASLPIVASFRSDNVEGFVRLLELTSVVRAERTGDTITLRAAR